MSFSASQISAFSELLSRALDYPEKPILLIEAVSILLPFEAALCVINRRHRRPLYLCDTYMNEGAKRAVQHYVQSTYLINPVYNSFLNDIGSGLYRMRDLAPDNWLKDGITENKKASVDKSEEIGFLTYGWPAKLEELVLLKRISDDTMVEISFAQPTSSGGFADKDIECLRAVLPLLMSAMQALFEQHKNELLGSDRLAIQLGEFGGPHLTPRENEIIQLILQGHSGKSICSKLSISMPTLKSHRKNAYAKLKVASQSELFSRFIVWKHSIDSH